MSIIYINPYQFAAAAAYDADAQDFINRVIAADVAAGNTSGLEVGVQDAYNSFFVGCKADGNFSALKASCILAGARTLSGALVPLVSTMPAPTQNGTAGGWSYNRKTGLTGNGTDNYLNSNRNNNADPQNNHHLAAYSSSIQTGLLSGGRGDSFGIGAKFIALNLFRSVPDTDRAESFGSTVAGSATFVGLSRTSTSQYTARIGSQSSTISSNSTTPDNINLFVFAQSTGGVAGAFTSSPISYYSIGESLDLAALDARVSTLMSDLAAAIP
jgi:hypothetical protein